MIDVAYYELALAHAQRLNVFTPTGLDVSRKLTAKDKEAIVLQLKVMGDSTAWARADLALILKRDNPQDYRLAWEELATILGKMPTTIANDALVAEKYSKAERQRWLEAGLSYSHCRIAASVEPAERREDALLKCVEMGWGVHQLSHFLFGNRPLLPPSRDVLLRDRVGGWLDTLPNDGEREYARSYVIQFLDWLEE